MPEFLTGWWLLLGKGTAVTTQKFWRVERGLKEGRLSFSILEALGGWAVRLAPVILARFLRDVWEVRAVFLCFLSTWRLQWFCWETWPFCFPGGEKSTIQNLVHQPWGLVNHQLDLAILLVTIIIYLKRLQLTHSNGNFATCPTNPGEIFTETIDTNAYQCDLWWW